MFAGLNLSSAWEKLNLFSALEKFVAVAGGEELLKISALLS